MSDTSINSVSSMRPVDNGANASRVGTSGAGSASGPKGAVDGTTPRFTLPEGAQPKPGAPAMPDPAQRQTGQGQQSGSENKEARPVMQGDNVSIRFRVDRQTNEVTVFIVDRASKRVLRSIPPEEVGKLQAGDIFELTG